MDTYTAQLKLEPKDNSNFELIVKETIKHVGEVLDTFPKNLNLQLFSITPNNQIILTFNKIKASVRFYDQIQENNFFSSFNIQFTKENFGSYDKKKITKDTTEIYISNCFTSPITGKEYEALKEIQIIIDNLLKSNQFQPTIAQSISIAKCYIYLSFSCIESANFILNTLQDPNWLSPSRNEFPFVGELHWDVKKANFVPIQYFSQTQESQQIYYSPKNYLSIPGLKLHQNFISSEEEKQLLDWIDSAEWEDRVQGKNKKKPMKRRVQHYGFRFNYENNLADLEPYKDGKIPEIFLSLIQRLKDNHFIQSNPDQLTINEYKPGQGILSHVDTHSAFEDEIISISLASDCGMEFCCFDDQKKKIGVYLHQCSAFILSGESRYNWKHGITKKNFDHVLIENEKEIHQSSNSIEELLFPEAGLCKRKRRVSLTFRSLRKTPLCSCSWPKACDTQQQNQLSEKSQKSQTQNKQGAATLLNNDIIKLLHENNEEGEKLGRSLERKHVVDFYETAAEHFSNTRHSPWPKIANFLSIRTNDNIDQLQSFDGIDHGMVIGDIGCGNGKYLRCIPNSVFCVGTDISNNLLVQSKKLGTHQHDLVVADGLALPLRSELCDVVICIAVFHHISTLERRLKLSSELLRILKPGGRLLVYAWAFEQKSDEVGSRKFPEQDCFVPWHLAKKKGDDNNEDEQVLNRFCHVFCEGELEELFKKVGHVSILSSYNDHSNWAVILRKET